MTRALVLRLEGPMQAWGGPVAGDDRPTLDAPTKSGVIGLVAGALGIDRAEVGRIRALHDGLGLVVRVDRQGAAGVDFQTIEDVPTAGGGVRKDPVISRRGVLYDAAFTVLLIERDGLTPPLPDIALALRYPRFLPFLGRRAFPPSVPALLPPGVREAPSWRDLLDGVTPARAEATRGKFEILADADLVEPGRGVVERRVRDVTAGTSPRFFEERSLRRTTHEATCDIARDTTEGWGA